MQNAVCVRRKKKSGEKSTKKFAPPKTHHESHSSPATATNSRQRATKHVPRGSPYSCASVIDPGFVEISLACIHTYPHCCCCAACIRFGALFSRQYSFCFPYCDTRYIIYIHIYHSRESRRSCDGEKIEHQNEYKRHSSSIAGMHVYK